MCRFPAAAFLDARSARGVRLTFMAQSSEVFNPDKQIDCTGLFCPMPIVKTREAIRQMAIGQVLEMSSDDPASEADMKSWAQITGHQLMHIARDGAVYRFLVRKIR
jgi:TusA-related sulfurtransferase